MDWKQEEKLAIISVRQWWPEVGDGLILHRKGKEEGAWYFLYVVDEREGSVQNGSEVSGLSNGMDGDDICWEKEHRGGANLKSYLVNEKRSGKEKWVWPRQSIHCLWLVRWEGHNLNLSHLRLVSTGRTGSIQSEWLREILGASVTLWIGICGLKTRPVRSKDWFRAMGASSF